jgi:hypothetical protein
MKCTPGTVTSVWSGQVRQNSRCAPVRIAPGSALMNSLGSPGVSASLRRVGRHHLDHLGRFAADWDLAQHRQHRQPVLARRGKRPAVLPEFVIVQGAQHPGGQNVLNE